MQSSQKGNQQPGGKEKKGKKGEGNQKKPKPSNNADGGKKDKKKVKFPYKLCQGDHLTHQFPLMEQAQKMLKNQQLVVLKDPFPQGQNIASISNVAGGTSRAPPDQNYINMVQSSTLLHTRSKNYDTEAPEKGKSVSETSNPLTIEKPVDPIPKIPKGIFKKEFHNPKSRVASNYSVVEYLAQTPYAMSALEVLQSCPTKWDALLATLGSMDSLSLMANLNLSDVKMHLPYHVSLLLDVIHGGKNHWMNSC